MTENYVNGMEPTIFDVLREQANRLLDPTLSERHARILARQIAERLDEEGWM